MNPRWLWRASLWARNPPSAKRIKLVFAVIAICAVLYGIEQVFGWPDWLHAERFGRAGPVR
jgi:hypothetical protein